MRCASSGAEFQDYEGSSYERATTAQACYLAADSLLLRRQSVTALATDAVSFARSEGPAAAADSRGIRSADAHDLAPGVARPRASSPAHCCSSASQRKTPCPTRGTAFRFRRSAD